ncbi:Helix-turn-helix domain protein [Botrimarina colliarenosi]|uniref:Helix-turn-helix domain protein n=1 Tax=Botrimarina colliarenosi TaxID=2528001 RepID=A0A5C6A9U7_9BACT|nr:helix-turn-helix domain-containing protein [Botrimarina colliarenosi]TWT96127.1 Helix-turn-helix domain protein [Botrimarina colliarenosi]
MTPPLLTVAMVAERLRVSRTTVYQLVESGKLGAHRIGGGRGAIRVSEDELAAYLQRCRDTAANNTQAPKPPARRLRHLRF